MGEPSASSTDNVANNALHQPAPTRSIVAEDDDEPPCSGLAPKNLQVINQFTSSSILNTSGTVSTPMKGGSSAETSEKTTDPFNEKKLVEREEISATCSATTGDALERNDTLVPAEVRPRTYAASMHRGVSRLRALFTPQRNLGPSPSYNVSIRETLRYTPLNILLLFIPVSWALHYTHQSPTLIFVFSCLAIIPLAALLGLGTEQIALRTSQSVGGLLNATLGNVLELIIAGVALKQVRHSFLYFFKTILTYRM